MSKTTKKHAISELEDIIRNLLDTKFSGGCKVTELLAHVMEIYHKQHGELPVNKLFEEIEKIAKKSKVIGMINYHWRMSPLMHREKTFVFTK